MRIQLLSAIFWAIAGMCFTAFFFCIASGIMASDSRTILITCVVELITTFCGVWFNLPRVPRARGSARKKRDKEKPTASVFQRDSAFDLASVGPHSVMILRAGEETFTQVPLNALQDEIQDCVVVDDDGHEASILTQHFILVDPKDTLTTLLFGVRSTEFALQVAETIKGLRLEFTVIFWSVFGLGGLLLIGFVVTGYSPSWLAFCFPIISIIEVVLLGGAINRPVLLRLMHTSFFAWRLFTTTVSSVVLVIALQDVRGLLVTSLWVSQMLGFCSDTFTGPLQPHRFIICFTVLLATTEVFVLILAGLVVSPHPVTVTISPTFDYSFTQLVRDMYIAMAIVLAFESEFIWRGAHRRRFLHIHEGVSYSVKTFENELPAAANRKSDDRTPRRPFSNRLIKPPRENRNKFAGQASQLEVKSGFLVKQQSFTQAESRAEENQVAMAFVHVNNIQLKQSASVAFALFGRRIGKDVFHNTIGRRGEL